MELYNHTRDLHREEQGTSQVFLQIPKCLYNKQSQGASVQPIFFIKYNVQEIVYSQ